MKNKKFLALFLALILLFSSFSSVLALDALNSEKGGMADIYAIARHAPSFFVPTKDWRNVAIRKTTPLYDLENSIIAYCIDIQNADTGKNAYVIISADETETPILQYAPDAVSPYYDITSSSRALYLMPGAYHVLEGKSMMDLATERTYALEEVLSVYQTAKAETATLNTATTETADFSALRQLYIAGVQPKGYDTKEKILSTVPNWQWTYGCSPTAIGMQLAKLYPSLNTTNTIAELAVALQTSASGSSASEHFPERVSAYIVSKGLGTPTYCNFPSRQSNGAPERGISSNPYSTYLSEINAGRAVAISSHYPTVSTPQYPNGWDRHTITGVEYSYMTSGSDKYVIVHTTEVLDGKVYINISNLGDFAWFIVRK